jgi:leukotriene-A4 hydrolase
VQEFKDPLKVDDVHLMREKYGFAKSQNVGIVSRYLAVGLRAKDEDVYEPTAELLGRVGRMKFVRPL